MNITHKAEITVSVRGAIVCCVIEAETIDQLRDVLSRLEHLDRVFGTAPPAPEPTLRPTPEPTPEPAAPIPPANMRRRWTVSMVKQAQELLDKGMSFEEVAARIGRTRDAIVMCIYDGKLTLPDDHPQRQYRRNVSSKPSTTAPSKPPVATLVVKPNGRGQGDMFN